MNFTGPQNIAPYAWTWANAAARNAQTVGAGDVGRTGYQTDMDLEYKLRATSGGGGAGGARWARLARLDYITTGFVLTQNTGAASQFSINAQSGQIGAYGARTLASTNPATNRMRTACTTATALAGSTFYARGSGGQQTLGGGHGWSYRIVCGPGAVTADMIWYYGFCNNLANGALVSPMSAVRNGLCIGADGGNLGILSASGSASTFTSLGASFPGVTADEIYEVEFYSPTGADLRYSVLRLSNGNEVSGTLAAANMPTWSGYFTHNLYATNNATAGTISVDLASIHLQQRER